MDARRGSGDGNRLADRRGQCGRGGSGCGRMRNDQLLAGRQRARTLVAIGLQDRGGRNIIAARQYFERVAGADDDGGAALHPAVGRRDRARRDAAGGLKRRMGGRRIGSQPAPSSGHAGAGGRIGLRRRDRRRQRRGLILAFAAGNIAEVRGARPPGAGTEPVASGCEAKGLEKEFCEKRVDMSALQPAKPIDISASTATCGTRREQSNSTTRDMVTHSYATKYCFE